MEGTDGFTTFAYIPVNMMAIELGKLGKLEWAAAVNWRKFRSQTSDNMDRWKAEQKVRRESQSKEKVKEDKVRES